MKKKKSSGCDGLSQEHLAAGAPTLTESLVTIFNQSICQAKFPEKWKEAVVTPVHKKGDKSLIDNYRPVSNLPAAAKLLELVICEQTNRYMEENHILPKSQHGFRQHRSTMTALTELQLKWATNTENKEVTAKITIDLLQ